MFVLIKSKSASLELTTLGKDNPFGAKAKRFTVKMAGTKIVEFEGLDIDRYGRTVGLDYIEGKGEFLKMHSSSQGGYY